MSEMVDRRRKAKTGQMASGERGECPPPDQHAYYAAIENSFSRWEHQFEKSLNEPDVAKAWLKLLEHRCDIAALKFALFYAASAVENSEYSREYEAFSRAKERVLQQIPTLSQALQELMTPRIHEKSFASEQLKLWRLKKRQIRLFEDFPVLLGRFKEILETIVLPKSEKRHIEEAHTIARGEAPFHIYVEETTGKSFEEDLPVLLEAGASAYGLERVPSYNSDAVNRRYRRFRSREKSEYQGMRRHVRRDKHEGYKFLQGYLDEGSITGALLLGAFQSLMRPKLRRDPYELVRRVLYRLSKTPRNN